MTKAVQSSGSSQRNRHQHNNDRPERLKTKVSKTDGFSLGRQEIDLRYIEQLIDTEQTAALSLLLKYAVEHLIDGKRTLPEIVEFLQKNLTQNGLAFFADNHKISCGYAVPRSQESTPASTVTDVHKNSAQGSYKIKSPPLRRSCRLSGDLLFILHFFRERKDFFLRSVISLRCKYHNV